MTQKDFLNIKTFGFIEFGVTLFFSMIICIIMLLQDIFYPLVICTVVLVIQFIVLIWYLWNKEKAKIYLIAAAIRFFLLIVVFSLCLQISTNGDDPNIYILIGSLLVSLIATIIHYVINQKKWNSTFTKWQQIKKFDLKHKRFSLIADNFNINMGKTDYKLLLEVGIVVPIECYLLRLIGELIGYGQITIMDFFNLVIIYLFSVFLSYLLLRAVNIIKIEREMNVEFLTEYADKEELARLSKINW